MKFCGQCGLQLAPESPVCPRCGEITEPELAIEELHTDDQTVAIMPQAGPATPVPQHKLVLGPHGSNPDIGAGDPTSAMPAIPTIDPTLQVPPAQYPSQQDNSYVYPDTSYPGLPPEPMGYQPSAGQLGGETVRPTSRPAHRTRKGQATAVALLILILLLLIPVATIAIVNPGILNGILGRNTPTPTPVVLTPSDHARIVMQQYYDDINKQDYRGAYNLWGSAFQSTHSYNDFAAGYTHTKHDDLTINKLTPQADGTVSTDITIVATEDSGSGTVQSTYQGTYFVGQENGAWKILRGNFQKVG